MKQSEATFIDAQMDKFNLSIHSPVTRTHSQLCKAWEKLWLSMNTCLEEGNGEEPDPVVRTVIQRMTARSKEGIKKYGCTMERTDVTTSGWIDHTIEELLDAAIYLERLKRDL